jgi:hypothetical protein
LRWHPWPILQHLPTEHLTIQPAEGSATAAASATTPNPSKPDNQSGLFFISLLSTSPEAFASGKNQTGGKHHAETIRQFAF